jgi:hypothetical protein
MNAKELMIKLDEMPIAKSGSVLDVVSRVHFEALDNASHTDGVSVYGDNGRFTEEFYEAWLSSVQTILACCDFVTDECCDWYRQQGVKF